MNMLPMPDRSLTLLPPWIQAIRYAEKRLENRSSGVGQSAAKWRYGLGLSNVPIIGLSQSKSGISKDGEKIDLDVVEQAKHIGKTHGWNVTPVDGKITPRMLNMGEWAGKLVLVAELLDILPPARCEGDPWHVPGQWGLILGRVWEVKPVPCMGGQGLWRSQWCVACKKIVADSHGLTCKTCLSKLASGPDCPQLEIVTEVL